MQAKPRVLIIYTGGTIGMIKDLKTDELKAFDFNHIYEHVPELARLNVDLTSTSFDTPVDSSEMNTTHWTMIAKTVFENLEQYDGFVILHGSDTMAYTASALSFMLQGLRKPVILTGSQLPIGTIRTDGKENLITAIEIAAAKKNGEAIVQEVAVYFEYSLYRGNRCSKVSANQFEAFKSPNYSELAIAGVNINFSHERLFRSNLSIPVLQTRMSNEIGLIKLFPGINTNYFTGFFDIHKVKGLIIETYGSGNAQSDPALQANITRYINDGGIVLNITQCSSGAVIQGKYETSSFFHKVGVISGGDLTTEAAVVKMMYAIANSDSREDIIEKLQKNLVGEMSIIDSE